MSLSFAPVSVNKTAEYQDVFALMMVEPRDKDLLPILESVEKYLEPKWKDFYIFGSNKNKQPLEQWFRNSKRTLHFYQIPKKFLANETMVHYSKFLEDPWIWKTIKAENILLVQTDAAICDHKKINPDRFTKFPYIGCAYGSDIGPNTWWHDVRSHKGAHFYGVGGVSMRKRSFMLECIDKNITGKGLPEDVFYSTCLGTAVSAPVSKPTVEDLHALCVETNYEEKYGRPSFSVHKPGLQMPKDQMDALRAECPAAWDVGLKERYNRK